MKEHLQAAQGNASKTVQNEIITLCGNLIRQKVVKSVHDARFFSVITDEATDAANHEQLSIAILFVNKNEPCGRFLIFLKCETGISGNRQHSLTLVTSQILQHLTMQRLSRWEAQSVYRALGYLAFIRAAAPLG